MEFRNEGIYPFAVEIMLKIVYSLVAALGMACNGGIIYIFMTKKIKMSSFKILLLNLTIGDCISSIAIWPYVFIDLRSLRGMKNADYVCTATIGQVLYWFSSVGSIGCLCFMSVNRYLAICKPRKAVFFNKLLISVITICLVWCTATSIALPNVFSYNYIPEYAICSRRWPHGFDSVTFSIVTSILGFIMPVSIITFTFFATRKYFWRRNFGTVVRPSQIVRRNRKMAIFMGLLIIGFFICWSPFFVYWILSRAVPSVFPKGFRGEYARMKVIRIVVLISLCNTVINPIIYGIRGDAAFRNGFNRLKRAICCSSVQATGEIRSMEQSSKEVTTI